MITRAIYNRLERLEEQANNRRYPDVIYITEKPENWDVKYFYCENSKVKEFTTAQLETVKFQKYFDGVIFLKTKANTFIIPYDETASASKEGAFYLTLDADSRPQLVTE